MREIAFSDGQFVDLKNAKIPVTDLAVQRGVGLFETLRTYQRVPFLLRERVNRLLSSARSLNFKSLPSAALIEKPVKQGIEKLKADEAVVKIILTGGDSHKLLPESGSRLFILFSPFESWPNEYYEKGISVITVNLRRSVPELKALSYIEATVAHQEALKNGYDEAAYQDGNNNILEGTNFNFGVIKDQQIITPDTGVLNGLTMLEVLREAKNLGLNIARRTVNRQDLRVASDVFITSATREVIPVVKIDKIKIGTGLPGKWSKILLGKYRENTEKQK